MSRVRVLLTDAVGDVRHTEYRLRTQYSVLKYCSIAVAGGVSFVLLVVFCVGQLQDWYSVPLLVIRIVIIS